MLSVSTMLVSFIESSKNVKLNISLEDYPLFIYLNFLYMNQVQKTNEI